VNTSESQKGAVLITSEKVPIKMPLPREILFRKTVAGKYSKNEKVYHPTIHQVQFLVAMHIMP
jgi:hypothetical protein